MIQILWVLLIPLLFFILNFFKWLKMRRFEVAYDKYWAVVLTANDHSPLPNIECKKQEIITLLKEANIQPKVIHFNEPLGFGQVVMRSANSLDNLFFPNQDFIIANKIAFSEASEVYRKRMINTINPLFLLDTLLFLPQRLLKYIGVSEENVASKILNVIYWVAGFIISILTDPVRNYIKEMLKLLFGS